MRTLGVIGLVATALVAGCSHRGGSPKPDAAAGVSPRSLEVDEQEAASLNGELPVVDVKSVCGADDRRFLVELANASNPLDYKVPKRLADVKPAPSEVLIAGTIMHSALGAGDFPYDHTLGSDFTADVELDEAYRGVGQAYGAIIDTVHVELAAGQLPHRVAQPGVDEQDWRDMRDHALEDLQDGFVPQTGDRVVIMGHFVVDCGHLAFQTELHPITFMAVAHTASDATVVHLFYNPYRETQLYHPDLAKALAFDDTSRLTDPAGGPFPQALFSALLRIQDAGPDPYRSADRLEAWAMLEADATAPPALQVCAPASTGAVTVAARFAARPGVQVVVGRPSGGCVSVRATLGDVAPAMPAQHTCVLPWDFLAQAASEAGNEGADEGGASDAGAASLDLKAKLGAFVDPQFTDWLDRDPVVNCYDPLSGPDLGAPPDGEVQTTTSSEIALPFYGALVVRSTGS